MREKAEYLQQMAIVELDSAGRRMKPTLISQLVQIQIQMNQGPWHKIWYPKSDRGESGAYIWTQRYRKRLSQQDSDSTGFL